LANKPDFIYNCNLNNFGDFSIPSQSPCNKTYIRGYDVGIYNLGDYWNFGGFEKMTDINLGDLEKLKWLIDLKNNHPEDYKKFWLDVEEIMGDMLSLLVKIQGGMSITHH
jgi:hypothetical protein